MKVTITSGQMRGQGGTINGDLAERKRTLGKDGKVMVRLHKTDKIVWIRTKHLSDIVDLFSQNV